jgi:hypothetical protein
MSYAPARFRQADIARAIRAVEQCGAAMRVRLLPDGSIVLEKDTGHATPKEPLAPQAVESM